MGNFGKVAEFLGTGTKEKGEKACMEHYTDLYMHSYGSLLPEHTILRDGKTVLTSTLIPRGQVSIMAFIFSNGALFFPAFLKPPFPTSVTYPLYDGMDRGTTTRSRRPRWRSTRKRTTSRTPHLCPPTARDAHARSSR